MSDPMQLSLDQARSWLSGAVLAGDGATVVRRVHSDTRTLLPGDLFVALRGERFDGNQFLAQARAAGAAAALCSDAPALRAAGLPGLVVSDSRRALGELAAGWRAQFRLPLIAVTGSNGKTTVTQMIASILRIWKPRTMLATEGNLNNDIGVPLTLLRLRRTHEVAVVELGMNHPGEIAQLAAIAQPTVALVNNAQREHQEFMASVEAVARENGAVITALGASGTAVFPADDAYSGLWHELAGARAQLTFAVTAGPNAADLHCPPPLWREGAWQIQAETPSGRLVCSLRMPGLHNVRNALAAAACALAAGVPLAAIAQGLQAFEAVSGRSRSFVLPLGAHVLTVVDDSYNANPDSVRAAIDVLATLPAPRLLVLGDMGEVGSEGPRFHAEVGAYAHAQGVEHFYVLGPQCAHAARAYGAGARHFADMQSLIDTVRALLPHVSSVLVKGSRFMRMERVVQAMAAGAAQNEGIHHAH